MTNRRSSRAVAVGWVLSLCALSLVLLVSCSRKEGHPSPASAGLDAVVDAHSLQPGVPRFFTYRHRSKEINFFVIHHDGKVLSFLDACVTCYRSRLGYHFSEGTFTCRDCNMKYSTPEIEKGFGGCFPIRVPGTLRDGKYYIPRAVLEKAAKYF